MSLPEPHATPEVEAFILAGGQSSRMGQDKALLPLAGVPLIERACNLVRSLNLEPRIAGCRSDLTSFAPTIADDPTQAGRGPLSGICAAMESSTASHALFLTVDAPLLPQSLLACLLCHAMVKSALITVASVAGFTQTFPAVIDRVALPSLRASLDSGNLNTLRAFRAASEILRLPFITLPVEILIQAGQIFSPLALPPGEWFLNLNSPEDLARAESLLAEQRNQVI